MKITKIRDMGEKQTWDIEVLPQHHYLLSNGCVSHNTLSMLADCSSGIEPLFAKKFTKTVLDGTLFDLSKKYEDSNDDLLVTAHDISVFDHIKIQAAFQTYTDGAVSKTINLPHDATENEVRDAYMFAWETGCKGITVYRDGCRAGGPLDVSNIIENGVTECSNGRCSVL